MQKRWMIAALSASLLAACDGFKNEKNNTVEEATTATVPQDWSCTAAANVAQIQNHLKDEYLKELDRSLRRSGYESDQNLLNTITQNLRFEISGITTMTADPNTAKVLECDSQLIVHFPKGLQKRAENAFLERPCEDCEGDVERDAAYTLNDELEEGDSGLTLANDQLSGRFNYSITKTDQEGLSLSVPTQSAVIDGVVLVSANAVQYASFRKASKEIQDNVKQYSEQEAEQMRLGQKAMDIRQKELNSEKSAVVERLNQTWERFNPEQKAQLQQDQSDWFERRDIDCKVLSQKNVYSMPDQDKETYQKHAQYWDDAMTAQNQDMQYSKCFNQKTNERIVYLSNLFN